jgi:hypothetical protein
VEIVKFFIFGFVNSFFFLKALYFSNFQYIFEGYGVFWKSGEFEYVKIVEKFLVYE